MTYSGSNDFARLGNRDEDTESLAISDERLRELSTTLLQEIALSDHPDWHNVQGWWVKHELERILPCNRQQSTLLLERIVALNLLSIATPDSIYLDKILNPPFGQHRTVNEEPSDNSRLEESLRPPVEPAEPSILEMYPHQSQVPEHLLEEWGAAKGHLPGWATNYREGRNNKSRKFSFSEYINQHEQL